MVKYDTRSQARRPVHQRHPVHENAPPWHDPAIEMPASELMPRDRRAVLAVEPAYMHFRAQEETRAPFVAAPTTRYDFPDSYTERIIVGNKTADSFPLRLERPAQPVQGFHAFTDDKQMYNVGARDCMASYEAEQAFNPSNAYPKWRDWPLFEEFETMVGPFTSASFLPLAVTSVSSSTQSSPAYLASPTTATSPARRSSTSSASSLPSCSDGVTSPAHCVDTQCRHCFPQELSFEHMLASQM